MLKFDQKYICRRGHENQFTVYYRYCVHNVIFWYYLKYGESNSVRLMTMHAVILKADDDV